ncbi:hypothetical protein PRZ48_012813 [Zasmidium cellare]|uniref:Antifreeze protein n=1 Tax=Zasmidium cellare TaxID=395010 RepID=A0ABR0E683_ZASCE|nr:hypothetical protein PRZ48_012813 [Zasmidium cellare]
MANVDLRMVQYAGIGKLVRAVLRLATVATIQRIVVPAVSKATEIAPAGIAATTPLTAGQAASQAARRLMVHAELPTTTPPAKARSTETAARPVDTVAIAQLIAVMAARAGPAPTPQAEVVAVSAA